MALKRQSFYPGKIKQNLSFPKNNPQLTLSCINEDTIGNILSQIRIAKALLNGTKLYLQEIAEVFTKSLTWHIILSIMLSPFADKNKAGDKKQKSHRKLIYPYINKTEMNTDSETSPNDKKYLQ